MLGVDVMNIKKIGEDSYKCPECGAEHSGNEWNKETSNGYYGITKIQDAKVDVYVYICPSCSTESDYGTEPDEVKEETVTITKREYDELLEIKFRYEELG